MQSRHNFDFPRTCFKAKRRLIVIGFLRCRVSFSAFTMLDAYVEAALVWFATVFYRWRRMIAPVAVSTCEALESGR